MSPSILGWLSSSGILHLRRRGQTSCWRISGIQDIYFFTLTSSGDLSARVF